MKTIFNHNNNQDKDKDKDKDRNKDKNRDKDKNKSDKKGKSGKKAKGMQTILQEIGSLKQQLNCIKSHQQLPPYRCPQT